MNARNLDTLNLNARTREVSGQEEILQVQGKERSL